MTAYRHFFKIIYRALLCLAVITCACSCKKAIINTGAPATTTTATTPAQPLNNIDAAQLSGWWYSTKPSDPQKIPVRYFGSDNVYFFDNTSNGGTALSGNWTWLAKDTLNIGPSNIYTIIGKTPVVKLTKDSLVFAGGDKYYKVDLPPITSKPIITMLANTYDDGVSWVSYQSGGVFAYQAKFTYPNDIVLDADKNLYICDINNEALYKVSPKGKFTTLVFSGPGRVPELPDHAEVFISLSGLAMDGSGNIYVADMGSSCIRKIALSTSVVTNIAGAINTGFSGDGGPAMQAKLNFPARIAVDQAGNVYINDQNNNRIRKVNASNGNINTVAGNGTYGFTGDGGPATAAALRPLGITVDAAGNLLIAELGGIRKVNMATGIITSIVGNGTPGFSGDRGAATQAKLNNPRGISFDKSGNLFIADMGNQRVREIYAVDGTINTVAGNGFKGWNGDGPHATMQALYNPTGVCVDADGNIYIVDQGNHTIRKVSVQ